MSCSRTKSSDAGEARTRGRLVSNQALYHWSSHCVPIGACCFWSVCTCKFLGHIKVMSNYLKFWRQTIRPKGYKTFFTLNSPEHKFQLLIKTKILTKKFLALNLSDFEFIMLINVKMPTIVGILRFMSRMKICAQLSWAWKKFYNLGASSYNDSHVNFTALQASKICWGRPAFTIKVPFKHHQIFAANDAFFWG